MLDDVARALAKDGRFSAWQITESRGRSTQRYQVFTRVEARRVVETRHWDVRVHVPLDDDKLGESSFSIVDVGEDLTSQLDAAYARARLVRNLPWTLPGQGDARVEQVAATDPLIVESAGEACDQVARAIDGAVTSAGGVELSASEVFCDYLRLRLVNSRGLDRSREETHAYTEYVLLAKGAGAAELEVYQNRRARVLGELAVEAQVRGDVITAHDGARAALHDTGIADVVIVDGGIEELFDAFVAHAAGASRFEGWSRFEVGQPIVDDVSGDRLSIASDATVPGALGSYAFDDVGVLGRRVDCVVDGVFRARACDQKTACWLGLPSTGRLGNTVVAPGRTPFEELLAPAARPLYLLQRFSQLSPHATTGAFSGEIRFGYRIEHGRRTPIRGGSVSGVVFDAFSRARLSAETTVQGRTRAPRAVRLDAVQITGA